MATAKKDETPAEQSPQTLTLDEFCAQLSATDKRVSLIGGFYASEKAAKHRKDTPAAFQQRYTAFSTQSA